MAVTLLGIVVFLHPAINVLDDDSIMALQLLRESYLVFPSSTTMDVRPEQQQKASSPIDVRLLGMVTEVRPEQPSKALRPILVTLLGIVMEVRPEQ